jgi:hypothetical protein
MRTRKYMRPRVRRQYALGHHDVSSTPADGLSTLATRAPSLNRFKCRSKNKRKYASMSAALDDLKSKADIGDNNKRLRRSLSGPSDALVPNANSETWRSPLVARALSTSAFVRGGCGINGGLGLSLTLGLSLSVAYGRSLSVVSGLNLPALTPVCSAVSGALQVFRFANPDSLRPLSTVFVFAAGLAGPGAAPAAIAAGLGFGVWLAKRLTAPTPTPTPTPTPWSGAGLAGSDGVDALRLTERPDAVRLTERQERALLAASKKARQASADARPFLLSRAQRLGFTADAVDRSLAFIRETAPLIVHVNLWQCLFSFEKDTHYRSQFETKTSNGFIGLDTRRGWERTMFGDAYDGATDAERVKYGTINLTDTPIGNASCSFYGRSLLVLNPDVRKRTTWLPFDSSENRACPVGTFDHCEHILNEVDEKQLRKILSVGSGLARALDSCPRWYCECQIHGPVQFSHDVLALIVSSSDVPLLHRAKKFARANHFPVILHTNFAKTATELLPST